MINTISINNELINKLSNKLIDILSGTLTARGKCVMLEDNMGNIKFSQDGAKIIKNLFSQDPGINKLLEVIKEDINNMAGKVGDGTSTTALLLSYTLQQITQFSYDRSRLYDIVRGIKYACMISSDFTRDNLAINISSEDYNIVFNIATIASKNPSLGELVAKAYGNIGKNGLIKVGKSPSVDTYLKNSSGFCFDRGYLNKELINNKEEFTIELNNCFILLYTGYISNANDIGLLFDLLQEINNENKSILIIATDIMPVAIYTVSFNKAYLPPICMVKAPSFGEYSRQQLEAISILTGGKVIDDQLIGLKNIKKSDLGMAESVKVSANETTIVNGAGSADKIEEYIKQWQYQELQSEYEMEKRQKIIAMMQGGICHIMAGGISDSEQNEKYDLLEDAVAAVNSSLKQGVYIGGGISLIKIYNMLDSKIKSSQESFDFKIGIELFRQSVRNLIINILDRTHIHPEIIFNRLQQAYLNENYEEYLGYNVLTGKYVENMKEEGILDAAAILIEALPLIANTVDKIINANHLLLVPEEKNVNRF